MPKRTELLQILPWAGGLNTSDDPALIQPTEFTILQNVEVTKRNTKKKRDGINNNWDSASATSETIIALKDYWYESSDAKVNTLVAISTTGSVYSYNSSGTRTDITGGSAWVTPTRATTQVFGNFLFLGAEGIGQNLKMWNGTDATIDNVTNNSLYDANDPEPPKGWILQKHLGRLWMNDPDRPDRLHYSETGNPFKWQGAGDSGALDIGRGDGDQGGITAIFPTFRGELFVAKQTKLYRISGYTPETFRITLVSDSIGCVSPQAVASVGTQDVIWASEQGFHSLNTTSQFGDFSSQFISAKIQKDFDEDLTAYDSIQARYLDTINSVLFAVSESGNAVNNKLFIYNTQFQIWYSWTGLEAASLEVVDDFDRKRVYFGRSDERVAKGFANNFSDIDSSGNDTAIDFRLKSGFIYADDSSYTTKGHKRLGVIYRPEDTHDLSVTVKVDAQSDQTTTISTPTSLDVLGSTFILGESVLGGSGIMAPYSFVVDGYGRGFTVELRQNNIDQQIEILGFTMEYERAGAPAEVRNV